MDSGYHRVPVAGTGGVPSSPADYDALTDPSSNDSARGDAGSYTDCGCDSDGDSHARSRVAVARNDRSGDYNTQIDVTSFFSGRAEKSARCPAESGPKHPERGSSLSSGVLCYALRSKDFGIVWRNKEVEYHRKPVGALLGIGF